MVRRLDKDRFLTALFAPEPARTRLMALYAFNLEVARTREQVSEPMIGEIRLQWWRDALDAIYQGTPPEHEVVQALAQAVEETNTNRAPLDRMINARAFDLYDEPMKTTDALIGYVRDTSSSLMQAGVAMVSSDENAVRAKVIDQAGIAWGLTGLLRALPIHIERNQQFIPSEILERHGLTWADFSPQAEKNRIAPVISELVEMARSALNDARSTSGGIERSIAPVLMLASLSAAYLCQIERSDFNPCTSLTDVPVFRKQLTMITMALFRRL